MKKEDIKSFLDVFEQTFNLVGLERVEENKIDGQSPPAGNNIILGYALGLQFQSIIRPFEFIYSRGDHSPLHPGPKQYNYYFKAGYIF